MIIRDIFSKPIDRDLKGVIKVGQAEDENIKQELEEYVVYDEGESKFVGDFKVSDTYQEGIHSTISLYKKEDAANVDLLATIKMDKIICLFFIFIAYLSTLNNYTILILLFQ